jgi:GTPase SAR1 family protein
VSWSEPPIWQPLPVPSHWIGTWKGWEDWCDSIGGSLVALTPEHLAPLVYVIGATGSGKTSLLQTLVASDIQRGHSIVVLDARGDGTMMGVELAARAKVDPSLVRYFDLRERVRPLGFNPLAGAGEPYFKALGFMAAVGADFESLGVQVAEYLQNAALLLAETGKPITVLDDLFHDRSVRLSLIATAQTEALKRFWKRYDALSADKQQSIASSVLNKVSSLVCTEGLRRMYGHRQPVDLGEHLRTPGSITLISLAVDQLQHAGWRAGSLFLACICREVFSQVDVPESRRNPIRLYVDEFEHFSWSQFEEIFAEGRRFRFSTVLAHQSLAQLSPKLRSIILDNAGVKVVLRTSHASAEILNRDLAGVRGAFDIAGLKVGEAILWIGGLGAQQIELNAPVTRESGGISALASQFLDQVRSHAGPDEFVGYEATDGTDAATDANGIASEPEHKKKPSEPGRLEDWLE